MPANTNLNRVNLFAIINNSPDAIWTFDRQFKLMAANKAFFQIRLDAYNKSINIGDDMFLHTPPKARTKWQPLYERVLNGERIFIEEKRLIKNKTTYVEITMNPVYDDAGVLIGCLGITRDVTQHKQAEKEIAAFTQKMETLTFKTSHELRNPITNIMALVTLSKEEHLTAEETKEILNLIGASVTKLDEITKHLISLTSKYNKG